MTKEELRQKLESIAVECLVERANRLSARKIWLKQWLRWHKIRRELRKFGRLDSLR